MGALKHTQTHRLNIIYAKARRYTVGERLSIHILVAYIETEDRHRRNTVIRLRWCHSC